MKLKKQKLGIHLASWDVYELDSSLDSLIQKLERIYGDLDVEERATVMVDVDKDYDYSGSCDVSIKFSYTREETDKELEKRQKLHDDLQLKKKEEDAKKEQRERAQYLRLHKKYGKEKESPVRDSKAWDYRETKKMVDKLNT